MVYILIHWWCSMNGDMLLFLSDDLYCLESQTVYLLLRGVVRFGIYNYTTKLCTSINTAIIILYYIIYIHVIVQYTHYNCYLF